MVEFFRSTLGRVRNAGGAEEERCELTAISESLFHSRNVLYAINRELDKMGATRRNELTFQSHELAKLVQLRQRNEPGSDAGIKWSMPTVQAPHTRPCSILKSSTMRKTSGVPRAL
jgi:hypothetical protein